MRTRHATPLTVIALGLMADIYRDGGPDCSNDGITATRTRLVVLGSNEVPLRGGIWAVNEADPLGTLVLRIGPGGNVIAVPKHFIDGLPAGHVGPMFGGNFVYTSDSRFPVRHPVPVHDRIESVELNRALSV